MDNKIYTKVFTWLVIGLLITFGVGYGLNIVLINNLELALKLFGGPWFWIIIIVELILAITLSAGLKKFNPIVTKILYLLYTAITGITFAAIFMYFEMSSIILIFGVTAVIFALFAIIGSKLNIDLSKFGLYLLIALIGVIVVSIINIFIGSSQLAMIVSAIAILIFTLYIGYDIRKIKALLETDIDEENIAVYGAFQLYLDFINIFIRLLELFGKAKD